MRKFRIEAVIEDGEDNWYRFAVEVEAKDEREAEIVFNLLYPKATVSVDNGIKLK